LPDDPGNEGKKESSPYTIDDSKLEQGQTDRTGILLPQFELGKLGEDLREAPKRGLITFKSNEIKKIF